MSNQENPQVASFDQHVEKYDRWFDEHSVLFESEIKALDKVAPHCEYALEVGVGTGRFASECGIDWGIDPSENMLRMAEQRGTNVLISSAEKIPFLSNTFGYVLMVTVDCFLDDLAEAYKEVHRVLKPEGVLVIGMIDKNSWLGKKYEQKKQNDPFYKDAEFHSPEELTGKLELVGFGNFEFWQTLITASEDFPEDPRPGYGEGGFVVIKAVKQV